MQTPISSNSPNPNGPGTQLKRILARFWIRSGDGCQCDQRALLMDEMGPDWCEENLETIVDWLAESAHQRHLPFSRRVARQLVTYAIHRARAYESVKQDCQPVA